MLSVLFVVNRSRGHSVIGLSYSDSCRERDSSLVSNESDTGDEIAYTWLLACWPLFLNAPKIQSEVATSNGQN